MKRKFYISVSSCLVGLLAFTATSCEDWLTVYPQDKVVEEEFWEDKNDLEGVRYGAYHQMAGTIRKLAVWGDLRSDSYNLNRTRHKDMGNYDMYDEIMKGMPDSSMNIFDWGNVYKTINLCNKVLSHGDEVLAKDAQFTTAEWYQMRAEMTALRALNYFYLIRAFKDVPYTTQVINNDRQVTTFGETNQLQILDSIILDCEKVKGQARNRFTRDADSKGLITNAAIYAMLADMYLWRGSLHQGRGMLEDSVKVDTGYVVHTVKGDYQLAADYADLSLASLAKQNQDRFSSSYNPDIIDTENYGLENCDMIENDFTGAYQSTAPLLEAQEYIFTNKNSIESIFELQYSSGEQENSAVNHLYGYSTGSHLEVSQDALGVCYGGWGNAKYDSRMWVGAQNLVTTSSSSSSTALSGYYCVKWQRHNIFWTGQQTSREIKNVQISTNKWCNWIIYRMTDVMLMKAEALACIGGAANNTLAKNIVNAIHRR
ncbi:MAG: RagB/SusD family nutrient uptake outer membrane protein, partial [Bacteroidaceae bacterium]|nr:RagB/SusD family nutrient uptake outer membrane protein [Bacteroidaceae bacterium]